ncbi:MAG: DUF2807 domain-containing protein [Pricia sp.]|nr:DUF2807 domain-containing protein [Pricia sp.]
MRNIVFLFSVLFCFQLSAQRKPKIKGNKSVIDVQESLPPFNAIELRDDLEIKLQKAPEEGYAITADDNLIDVLKFNVEGSTLVISSFYKITGKKKLEITVNYNYIDTITLHDGKIKTDGVLSADELFISTNESSKLELNADARLISITMEGNSSGDFNLSGEEMNFVLKDRIDARIYSVSTMNNLKMYKNASVRMEGTAQEFRANLFESANLKGERLEANTAFLTVQDSPSADVNVITDFQLTSSGSSKTHLYGNPKIEIIEFLDTSELHKEK